MSATILVNEQGVATGILVPEGESVQVVKGAGAAQREAILFGRGRYGTGFHLPLLHYAKGLISVQDTTPEQPEAVTP